MEEKKNDAGHGRQCWPIVMFFNLSDDCMATDQMTINRNGWKSKKKKRIFVTLWNYTMWIYIKRSLLFVDIMGKMIWLIKSLVMFAHIWLWFISVEHNTLSCSWLFLSSSSCPSSLPFHTFYNHHSSDIFHSDWSYTGKTLVLVGKV